MDIRNKTVVITGGSDGLGFALAKRLLAKGATVHIIGRNEDHVHTAIKSLGENAVGHVVDVRDLNTLSTTAQSIGSVDALITCAAVWIEGMLLDVSEQDISTAVDINVKGVIYTTKAFLPKLLESKEAHIIHISSTTGLSGRKNQSIYAATKFAVTGFVESLKEDLAHTSVKVSGFYPGGMKTSFFDKAMNPKENTDWMSPDAIAEIIVFLLERDATMVIDRLVVNKRNTKTSN